MSLEPPQIIFGDIRELDPTEFKAAAAAAGVKRLDTAARYMNGESERKIGRAKLPESFSVDTKILYTPPGDGTLSAEAIEKSLSNSLNAIGVEKVNVLYCHAPDFQTPIAEQARAMDEQYKKGRFTYLGVSNFPTPMLEEWLTIAEKEGLIKPSVYQGQYNLLCRGYENTLFPLLRQNRIRFNGFSPLAGGFLLGNFTEEGVQAGSRFAIQTPFTTWYNKPSMHEAIRRLRKITEEQSIGMDELSLRWVVHHSILGNKDGVIIGASKVQHLEKNVAQIEKGPLGYSVAEKLNELWEGVKADAMSIVEASR